MVTVVRVRSFKFYQFLPLPVTSRIFCFVIPSLTFAVTGGSAGITDRDFKSWKSDLDLDFDLEEFDKEGDVMDSLVSVIIGIAVFVLVAMVVFTLCLCCPICLLAKMRSRRRGTVYRTVTQNGTRVTTAVGSGGTSVAVTAPRRQNAPPLVQSSVGSSTIPAPASVVAIHSDTFSQNKPYPVQPSVTVVPVNFQQPSSQSQPQPVPPPALHPPYPPSSQPVPAFEDLPPPYPGLPRDPQENLPYNPYYREETNVPTAPPKE